MHISMLYKKLAWWLAELPATAVRRIGAALFFTWKDSPLLII
jgi:hypothetical protein